MPKNPAVNRWHIYVVVKPFVRTPLLLQDTTAPGYNWDHGWIDRFWFSFPSPFYSYLWDLGDRQIRSPGWEYLIGPKPHAGVLWSGLYTGRMSCVGFWGERQGPASHPYHTQWGREFNVRYLGKNNKCLRYLSFQTPDFFFSFWGDLGFLVVNDILKVALSINRVAIKPKNDDMCLRATQSGVCIQGW